MTTLVLQTLRRATIMGAAIATLVGTFNLALVAIAATFEDASGFERLTALAPTFIQHTFGPALGSFRGLTTLGFYEPLIVLVVVEFTIYLATEPAGDVEFRLVDLILARPVPRQLLVTRSVITMLVGAFGLPLFMAATLLGSLMWLAPADAIWPDRHVVLLLAAHLVAVAWCFGGAGLAAAAWSRRRGGAQALVGIGAVAFYFMDFVGDAWSRASWLAWLSPFHAFHGVRILTGDAQTTRNLIVLFGLGAIGVALGYWRFQRRDV